ncbi:MAG: TRAP transporter small permease [Burkholderiaceae bacterium]
MAIANAGSRSHWSDAIEETFIAAALGAMTLITFANVIARYVFNTNILWALEATVFLFAWLVLIGASYGVKHHLHIGIDILVNALPAGMRRALTLLAALACIVFCLLLLKGAWDYWWPFASKRSFMETNDVPLPGFLQFLGDWFNEGERYEKLPRFIPYFCLPLGMALLLWRFLQAAWRVASGAQRLLIAAHEAEGVMPVDEAGVPAQEG